MYELKKIGEVFTSKFVGTGPSSYKKRIYRAAVSQRLRNTILNFHTTQILTFMFCTLECISRLIKVTNYVFIVRTKIIQDLFNFG